LICQSALTRSLDNPLDDTLSVCVDFVLVTDSRRFLKGTFISFCSLSSVTLRVSVVCTSLRKALSYEESS
jgi:hypothetical protein